MDRRGPSAPTGIYVNERRSDGNRSTTTAAGRQVAGSAGDIADDFIDGLGVLHTTGVTLAISASAAMLRAALRGRA